MSRIADALQKSRAENAAHDQPLGPDLQSLRPLAQVQIPWFLGEVVFRHRIRAPGFAPAPSSTAPAGPKRLECRRLRPGREPRPPRNNDEAVAGLIRNLFQVRTSSDRAVRRLLFTSVDDNRCSSDIAPRVAEALAAQSNRSVCLADLDLHNPTLHRRVPAIEHQRGFADAVVERGPLRACTHGAPSHANLWLLPAGAPTLDVIPLLSETDTTASPRRLTLDVLLRDRVRGAHRPSR